ncbi:MAG: PD40 domain-containing protein, partial [Flavobacteriales bacterium]|nr:PD40 domain-containing protein [Flavobacteriales bacterium]
MLGSITFGYAQKDGDQKLYKDAVNHFEKAEYMDALKLFKRIQDKTIKNDGYFCYMFGMCYFNSDLEKVKSIPYFEKAIDSQDKRVPQETLLYVGEMHHFLHRFAKAKMYFGKYKDDAQNAGDETRKKNAEDLIAMTDRAENMIYDSLSVAIKNLGLVVNSPWAEHSPVISADERILIFTATERQSVQDLYSKQALDDRIYISYRKDSVWTIPSLLRFDGNEDGNFGSVGLYPDGQKLMIYKGNKKSGSIYLCISQPDSSWSDPEKISHISSKFWEGSASITPDENTIYFSSNRPGGYGGKDIYKVERTGFDTWSKPINLGPMINTPEDEDSPFIHPDQKTLYFSSKGHDGMGGFDIFKTKRLNIEWTVPVNLGFPINSTGDDIYFVMSADGQNGYFASNRTDGFGDLDLYSLRMPSESIPLTMIRGKILAGDPAVAVKAKIKVVDRETNKQVKYVYNPNPKTGKYLMIFPPGKNYDMIIEAEGYTPHLINIYVPQQTYFYELYQEIHLSDIRGDGLATGNDTIIGEQVSVRNTFYDIRQVVSDSSRSPQFNTYQKEYEPLLTLIEKLIQETDSSGLSKLEMTVENMVEDTGSVFNAVETQYSPLISLLDQIIETTDSIALRNIDRITSNDALQNEYYYGQDLVPYYFGDDTLYTTSPFYTYDRDGMLVRDSVGNPEINHRLKRITLYYPSGEVAISKVYHQDLTNLVALLKAHPNFAIRVDGYTDEVGKDKDNMILSKRRSDMVKQFLI